EFGRPSRTTSPAPYHGRRPGPQAPRREIDLRRLVPLRGASPSKGQSLVAPLRVETATTTSASARTTSATTAISRCCMISAHGGPAPLYRKKLPHVLSSP